MIFSYLFLKERSLIICISSDFGVECWPTPGVAKIDPRNSLGVTNNITATHIGSQRMSHQELLVKEIHKFWKISADFESGYFSKSKNIKFDNHSLKPFCRGSLFLSIGRSSLPNLSQHFLRLFRFQPCLIDYTRVRNPKGLFENTWKVKLYS